MTRSERIENAASAIAVLGVAGVLLRPAWAWLDTLAIVVLLGGMGWAYFVRTPADRERTRKNSWLLPAVALAMAVQWVYFSGPEQRLRTSLLGAGLVLAATALAWKRRTSAP